MNTNIRLFWICFIQKFLVWQLHSLLIIRRWNLLLDTQSREHSGAHCYQGHTCNSKCNQVLMKWKCNQVLMKWKCNLRSIYRRSLSACYCKTVLPFIRLMANPIAVSSKYIHSNVNPPPFLIELMEYRNYFKVGFPWFSLKYGLKYPNQSNDKYHSIGIWKKTHKPGKCIVIQLNKYGWEYPNLLDRYHQAIEIRIRKRKSGIVVFKNKLNITSFKCLKQINDNK